MAPHVAHVDEWTGEDVSLREVDRALCELRESSANETEGPDLRTSVMTHIAWVPADWQEAALGTLAGLAERHPSRSILLFPDPEAADGLDAKAVVLAFPLPGSQRHVAAEVIELRLRGKKSEVPGSLVAPLLISDLPVFVRWRGRPPFGASELEQLVDLADRLVVDSIEWSDLPKAYVELAGLFDRVAVSDLAWRRTLPWRRGLAGGWPKVGEIRELRVVGPAAEARLLTGWLRSRLHRPVELAHEDAKEIELVSADGEEVSARAEPQSASDLLSDDLDQLGRDPVYEGTVRAASA